MEFKKTKIRVATVFSHQLQEKYKYRVPIHNDKYKELINNIPLIYFLAKTVQNCPTLSTNVIYPIWSNPAQTTTNEEKYGTTNKDLYDTQEKKKMRVIIELQFLHADTRCDRG